MDQWIRMHRPFAIKAASYSVWASMEPTMRKPLISGLKLHEGVQKLCQVSPQHIFHKPTLLTLRQACRDKWPTKC